MFLTISYFKCNITLWCNITLVVISKGVDFVNKTEFCKMVQNILEDIRKNENMTLEEMALTIGLSKKTLIQIEKNRSLLKWPEAVTFVTIFNETELVKSIFGDEILDIIQSIAILKPPRRQLKTFGGESWWKTLIHKEGFRLQQHKISRHLRILDQENYRVYFTYSKSDAEKEFDKYFGGHNE